MRQKIVGGAVLAAVFCLGAAWDDESLKDRARLQGTWQIEIATCNGEKVPADELVRMASLTFKGDEMIPGDQADNKATYKLDPSQRPAAIDLTGKTGLTSLAIYEIEGDTLRICFALPYVPRPNAFESPKGSLVWLLVLKREKK